MKNTIQTIEQKSVIFYDDELLAVRSKDGQIYVSFRHLCDSFGLDRRSQLRKIRDHEILSEGYAGGVIMTPPGERGGGGRQQAGLLLVDLIPLWLTTINTKRVREEIRDKIKRYQREAAKVLWEAFQSGRLTMQGDLDELLKSDSPAANAYRMAIAMAELARQQLFLEAQIEQQRTEIAEQRQLIESHSNQLQTNSERLERLENTVETSSRYISDAQASEISQAVKAIARELSKQSGRNEYGGVYGELYRRFSITSYKQLPANKFQPAMNFLNNWYAELTDGSSIAF